MTVRKNTVVFAVINVIAVFSFVLVLRKPQPVSSGVIDDAEYQRLLSISLAFGGLEGKSDDVLEGNGSFEGAKPPVTPHPHGPAFGDGVKVAMTDAEFFQFYQPYQSPKHPVFVTSDSLIQAYFDVFQQALLRAEAMDGWDLKDAVADGLNKIETMAIDGPPELVERAKRLARINLAIVSRLFNAAAPKLAKLDDDAIVADEVRHIEAGDVTRLPGWLLDPKDDEFEIDYRVFGAVGERRSELSRRRFGAIRWLSHIPWNADRDDHLLACLIAARATERPKTGSALRDSIGTMLMPADDVDAKQLADWHGEGRLYAGKFAAIRKQLRDKLTADPPRLNDQVRYPPTKDERYVRWRSAGRGHDLVALKQVYGPGKFNGLALCASLGSTFARSRTEARGWEAAPPLTAGSTLGAEFWKTMAPLFDPPRQGAPAFMNHREWQIKSCQTALSGWVLWRHAVEPFSKSDMYYQSENGPLTFRGAVEPNPTLFRRIAALAVRTKDDLRSRGLLEQTPRRCAALIPEQLEALIALRGRGSIYDEKNVELRRQAAYPMWLHSKITASLKSSARDAPAAALAQFHAAASENRWPENPNAANLMKLLDDPTEKRLKLVVSLAEKCAEIAEKQLAGKPQDDADECWFLNYGRVLAGIAGYQADADELPADDAAQIAEVVFDPSNNSHRTIAVGRPRALWVLYPYQGKEVLCRGAVYPYYEFDSTEKPSDETWQKTVRAGKQPPQPEWIKPLLRKGTPEKNVEK